MCKKCTCSSQFGPRLVSGITVAELPNENQPDQYPKKTLMGPWSAQTRTDALPLSAGW